MQDQIEVDYSHRRHTREDISTGFQTAGLLGRISGGASNLASSAIDTTQRVTPDYGFLSHDDSSEDYVGYDSQGEPVTDKEKASYDKEGNPVNAGGLSRTHLIIGGVGFAALIGITLIATGEEDDLELERFMASQQLQGD